ncbi:MAG: DUF692 domain-containing protein [Polyangiaceae bacterium]|nr:DUF692 domain-containing protein [Polyangiaceae bacterium]
MENTKRIVPDLGVGMGLRVPHYAHILEHNPEMAFFEAISENFLVDGGKPLYHLDRISEKYPLILHGVSLNIGGADELNEDYLKRLKELVRRVKPAWISDHFCWCGVGGAHLHDLLPLPFTEEVVSLVAERAHRIQDYLEVPFALENTSSYLDYRHNTMTEWQFVSEVVERAQVGLMFDVNNVYVSAYNHGFDAFDFVRSVPHERIFQIHMAGHTNRGTHIIDTHGGAPIDPVLDLYRTTVELSGAVSTLLEWDDEIPGYDTVASEVVRISQIRDDALRRRAGKSESQRMATAKALSLIPERAGVTLDGHGWVQGGPRESAGADHGVSA